MSPWRNIPMSTNISKQKRDALISKINAIKEYILSHPQDENALNLLSYTNEIENELRAKRFGLVFEEHLEKIDEVLSTHLPFFKEEEKLFINNGGEMNFLIEGDNLASLNLLLKTHKGKIDLIYIDPPYNTGNKDFIYDDNFVDSTDTFRHSKWLSFMEKRLKLARKLLSENGVIFISIDEHEFAELKLLCDSIFGEDNFLTIFNWMKTATPPSLSKTVRKKLEPIIAYKRNEIPFSLCGGITSGGDMPLLNEGNKVISVTIDKNSLIVKIPDGKYSAGKYDRVVLLSDFIVVNGKANVNLEISGPMKWTQETIDSEIKNETKFYIKSNKFAIRYERVGERIKVPSNIITVDECGVGTNEEAQKELKCLFDDNIFSYPKPTSLISYLVNMLTYYNSSSTVLDFFAGSGTTGHAVMKLNAEDGGKRKFILCTNNENNIARDVCYERIKRVVNKEKYEASLKYFKVDYLSISDKLYYEYADELLKHVRELVELENGINFNDNSEIAIILTEDELDEFTKTIPSSCKKIYLGHDILLSLDQEQELKKRNIQINIIPDYYYNEESI